MKQFMRNYIHVIKTIAGKELRDALKSKLLLSILCFFIVASLVSILMSSFEFQSKVNDYNTYIQTLRNSSLDISTIVQPQLFPLQLTRGVIEYIEIVGALLGILLGYISISKEKGKNTLQLILTRPITRIQLFLGKFIGNLCLVSLILIVLAVFCYLIIWLIGGMAPSFIEFVKFLLAIISSLFYILIFYLLSSTLTLYFKYLPQALIICFSIWLVFVLLIPQVGDTMDPDNQVPGGLFKSLNVNKDQEKKVLEKFKTYETIRNAVEESSITKHYERAVFAVTGIKDQYNGKNIVSIFNEKWNDFIWMLSFVIAFSWANIKVFKSKKLIFK